MRASSRLSKVPLLLVRLYPCNHHLSNDSDTYSLDLFNSPSLTSQGVGNIENNTINLNVSRAMPCLPGSHEYMPASNFSLTHNGETLDAHKSVDQNECPHNTYESSSNSLCAKRKTPVISPLEISAAKRPRQTKGAPTLHSIDLVALDSEWTFASRILMLRKNIPKSFNPPICLVYLTILWRHILCTLLLGWPPAVVIDKTLLPSHIVHPILV